MPDSLPLVPQNQRRPLFPKIPFGLGNFYGNDASSSYNAFEAKVDKRFNNGLQFMTHYTFSHANGYDSNYYAISHPSRMGLLISIVTTCSCSTRCTSCLSAKARSTWVASSRAMDYVVGGWQVSNTTNWSSGLPWTPSFGECGNEQDAGVCRPDKGRAPSTSAPVRWIRSNTRSLTSLLWPRWLIPTRTPWRLARTLVRWRDRPPDRSSPTLRDDREHATK